MNTITFDISVFDTKPQIYRDTALLISKNSKMAEGERFKWFEFIASIPKETIVKRIYDHFAVEEQEIKNHENQILGMAKKLPPLEYKKVRERQMFSIRNSFKRAEGVSDSFDDMEINNLENEIEDF